MIFCCCNGWIRCWLAQLTLCLYSFPKNKLVLDDACVHLLVYFGVCLSSEEKTMYQTCGLVWFGLESLVWFVLMFSTKNKRVWCACGVPSSTMTGPVMWGCCLCWWRRFSGMLVLPEKTMYSDWFTWILNCLVLQAVFAMRGVSCYLLLARPMLLQQEHASFAITHIENFFLAKVFFIIWTSGSCWHDTKSIFLSFLEYEMKNRYVLFAPLHLFRDETATSECWIAGEHWAGFVYQADTSGAGGAPGNVRYGRHLECKLLAIVYLFSFLCSL